MDVQTLTSTLQAEGFALTLAGCNAITVSGPMHRLTPELRQSLKEHKPTLLSMLATEGNLERLAIQEESDMPADAASFPFGANTRCDAHNEPANWETQPAPGRKGWLRTTCKTCGAFIGYRRDDTLQKGK